MAPLAPAPSARPCKGLPTGPTDGAVGACLPLVALPLSLPASRAISAALARCMYADMLMHDQDEQGARHHARQAHFPFLLPSSPPVCVLALRWPSLAPSRLRVSLSFRSVLSLVCLPVLPSVPLLPLPSRSLPGTSHDTVPGSCTFLRVGHLVPVSIWAMVAAPPRRSWDARW